MQFFATPAISHALGGTSLLDDAGTGLDLEAIHQKADWFLANRLKHESIIEAYSDDVDVNEHIALKSALLLAQEQLRSRHSLN